MGMFLLCPSNSDIVNFCAAKDKSKITQISEHDIHEEWGAISPDVAKKASAIRFEAMSTRQFNCELEIL
jgi:hypothetical protein